jgi:membrane-associated phospholipid phosphatase
MRLFANGRSVGVTDAIHGLAEWPVILLFGLVTQLGDGWFLFVLGGALFVAGEAFPVLGIDRRRALFVFGLALTYVAVIGVLKGFFGLGRPPGAMEPPDLTWVPAALAPLLERFTTAEGPGFPSGHALGTTMVWGGAALVLDEVSDRVRFGLAGVVVTVVSFARLVLGVHYAVDVIAGAALGLGVLGVCYWLANGGSAPGRVLAVAVAAGIVGIVVDGTDESVAAAGIAIGAWLAWRIVADTTPERHANRRELLVGALALIAVGGLFGVLYLLEAPAPVAFAGAAVAGGGVVAAPVLGDRLA